MTLARPKWKRSSDFGGVVGNEEKPQTIPSLTTHLIFSMVEALTSPLKGFKGLLFFFPQ